MTDGEILRSYKTAKNPAAQIKVLAELNSCKPAEIVNVLISQGVDISAPSIKKPKNSSQFTGKLQVLYDQGLSDKAMAAGAGCSPATVARYRKINKLPPNDPSGGDENKEGTVLFREKERRPPLEPLQEKARGGSAVIPPRTPPEGCAELKNSVKRNPGYAAGDEGRETGDEMPETGNEGRETGDEGRETGEKDSPPTEVETLLAAYRLVLRDILRERE